MATSPQQHDDDVDAWRLGEVERKIAGITDHAVSREWLDERLGRFEERIERAVVEGQRARRELERDIAELKEEGRQRRRANYAAIVGAVVSLLVSIVLFFITSSIPVSP